jgi:hypothetical protein
MSIKKKKNSPNRKHRVILAILAVCILVLGAILYSLPTQPEPVDPMTFANAELERLQELHSVALQKWTNRDFEDYRYFIRMGDACILVIIVQENIPTLENISGTNCGRFITAAALQGLRTVDDFMTEIQTQLNARECGYNGCRCDGYIIYETEYHPTLGYPLTSHRGLTSNIIPTPTVPPHIPTEEHFGYILFHLEACSLVGVGGLLPPILALQPMPD